MPEINSFVGNYFYLGKETKAILSRKTTRITKIEFSGAEYRTPQYNSVCFIFYKKGDSEDVFILTSMLRFHAREIPNVIQEVIFAYLLSEGEEES